MQIHVTFESLEEMFLFSGEIRSLNGGTGADTPSLNGRNTKPAEAQESANDTLLPVQQVVTTLPPVNQQPPVTQQVPTSAPSYVLDDLARAAMTLMDAGKQADLQELLKRFGVEALPVLPQEQYGAFATALRGMGAQI